MVQPTGSGTISGQMGLGNSSMVSASVPDRSVSQINPFLPKLILVRVVYPSNRKSNYVPHVYYIVDFRSPLGLACFLKAHVLKAPF